MSRAARLRRLETAKRTYISWERVELWIPSNGRNDLPLGVWREVVTNRVMSEAEYRSLLPSEAL